MSDNVRVSIVTPFMNAGRFIEESIESVLGQTYERWELLLVDDGSTDDSTAIARRYADAHPEKIRYLAHPGRENYGASASRNLGARHARGQYLAYLDADDIYLPRKLEHQVPLLDAHRDVAMLYAATEYWSSWTQQPEDAKRDWIWRKYGADPNAAIEPPRMLAAFLRDGGTVPCMGSVLVRRAAVESVGGWDESFRRIYTDQVFHAKLCLRFRVLIADVCLDRYRQHDDSACRSVARAGQAQAAFARYLTWLEAYLASEHVTDPDVWTALRSAQWRCQHRWQHRLWRQTTRYKARLRAVAANTVRRMVPESLRRGVRARWN
jgi:glycosyltransferase involved in cell wall biosynthesis